MHRTAHSCTTKTAIPGLVWPGLPDATGTVMLALLAQMEDSQWWSTKVIRKMQWVQLQTLLRFAMEHAPYYGERYPTLPSNSSYKSWFSELPILTREQVSKHFNQLQSTSHPAYHGSTKTVTTSGSTGKPIRVVQSEMFSVFEGVGLLRQHHWHQRDFSLHLAAINQHGNKHGNYPNSQVQNNWGWPIDAVYTSGKLSLLGIRNAISDQAEWLERNNPHYLLSPPSNLRALAEFCLENDVSFSNLMNVSTTMEVVDTELRELVHKAWGTPIIDQYSCREVGSIAHQCAKQDHYHICAENVYVEILDENNKPCSVGETGRVIVTGLHNFAMPLIRYELADYAEVGEPCSCGRGLPVLKRVLGRVRNMLKMPNGEKRWPSFGRPKIREIAPIESYQFIQISLDTIEVRLTTYRAISPEEEQSLIKHFHSRLPYPYHIKFKYFDRLPSTKSGKVEDFICKI